MLVCRMARRPRSAPETTGNGIVNGVGKWHLFYCQYEFSLSMSKVCLNLSQSGRKVSDVSMGFAFAFREE